MSVVRVKIEPEVIKDAVTKSGRSLEEVKNRYHTFEKWINKELEPTYNQLVDLSKFLRIPFGYLLLKAPVTEDLPLLEFRTIDTESINTPSRELIDTIYDMERKQEWLRERLIEEEREPLRFVGMFNDKKNISHLEVASKIREVFSLDIQWYKKANSDLSTFSLLRQALSQHGVVIMQNGIALNNTHRPLDIEEFRAFTLVDNYAPLIFINSLDSSSGKTFSLLHEVTHIFFGINSLYNDDFLQRDKYVSSIEIICNKVAGEIIAPTDIFISEWKKMHNCEEDTQKIIANLANVFKVSKLIVARKALDQKFIDFNQYNEIAEIVLNEYRLSQGRKRERSGGHPVNNALSRLDSNFMRVLIGSTENGTTNYSEAYRLAGVGRGVFEDVSLRLKGVR